MKKQAWSLGLAGLLPFFGLPLLATLNLIDWYTASEGFRLYSGIILSFFGGIHWYDSLSGNTRKHQIYVAMLPSIVAWLSLFLLPVLVGLALMSVSYALIMIYDKLVLTLPKERIIWYTKLRMTLTTFVVISHAWVISVLS